ncbi:MAG: redoxin domain-containing protein, partial [Acidobacteriaceae bacterium]|nr:redoxin domain-containing protein [Acidobacteriaceae bacterium]
MFFSFRFAIAAAICASFALPATGPVTDVTGAIRDPFSTHARARVFLFVRTDCPITNRYAPELQRLAQEFKGDGVDFWMVYPDP